jgi:signal transduction histidine kinase
MSVGLTPFTKTEKVYIEKLIKYLEEGSFVFILGPMGMGKTTIIKGALPRIKKSLELDYFFFDLGEAQKGAHYFYNLILKTISGKNIEEWGPDLSNEFISRLDNHISKPSLFIFDNFRAINRDFYEQFSADCRKIKMEGVVHPGSGLSKILMVFSGSLIGSEHKASPLWNITERIEILPLPQNEAKKVIIDYFKNLGEENPPGELVDKIHDSTLGHRYLAGELARFASKKGIKDPRIDTGKVIEDFSWHIWSVVNKPGDVLDHNDIYIRRHFLNIVEYLETSPYILRVTLDLIEDKTVAGPRRPRIDNISITGAISKDDKGYYSFLNPIYEKFFKELLTGYRKGNLCLFHIQEDDLWQKAMDVFRQLRDQGIKRDIRHPVTPRQRNFSDLVIKMIERLRSQSTSSELVQEFNNMLDLVFNLRAWAGPFRVNKIEGDSKIAGPDAFFNEIQPPEKKIDERDINVQGKKIIDKALRSHTHMIDWTGQWLTVPAFIREDFVRLFLARIDPEQQEIIPRITTFIQESLWAYYSLRVKEKSQEELNKLQERINLLSRSVKSDFRNDLKKPWEIIKHELKCLGIEKFTLHEVLTGGKVISNENSQKNPSSGRKIFNLKELPELNKAVDVIRKGTFYYLSSVPNRHFVGKVLDYGVILIVDFIMKDFKVKSILPEFSRFLDLFTLAIEKTWDNYQARSDQEMLRRALIGTDDYFYIVNKERKILYMGEKLEQLLRRDGSDYNRLYGKEICGEVLQGSHDPCSHCLLEKVYESREVLRLASRMSLAGKEGFLDCAFVPILKENSDQIIAVAVYMHDVEDRQRLWEVLVELQKKENVQEMEKLIFDTLAEFGFSRVFRFRPDPKKKGVFISEDYKGKVKNNKKGEMFRAGKIYFINPGKDIQEGRVSVWHRKNTPRTALKEFLENRLRNSGFDLKESFSRPAYYPQNKNRPDFWVSVPICGREGIVKLYALDNWGDDNRDREVISLDRLQVLETFGQAAGQILENARRWGNFQAMLSHGTMEPLQVMRLVLDRIANLSDKDERKRLAEKAEAALGFAQSALGSILTLERGPARINTEKVDINSLIEQQTALFQAYKGEKEEIKFILDLPDKSIIWETDRIVLVQILNNLAGNTVRHLARLNRKNPQKKIRIKASVKQNKLIIEVSDNGEGLPPNVREYFKRPYKQGIPFPSGGIGLGFSREMADLLGGSLELIEPPSLGRGTTFQLSIEEF